MVVTFEATNVPLGNTIQLRVIPAYGMATSAVSGALAGNASAATAEASVTLPQGPSALQATTTYTVTVAALHDDAMREKLSRLAQNERVEKVEVTVALQGGARAKLITDSGKAFEMPYAALSAIGFKG